MSDKTQEHRGESGKRRFLIIAVSSLVFFIGGILLGRSLYSRNEPVKNDPKAAAAVEKSEPLASEANQISLSAEALKLGQIEIGDVVSRQFHSKLEVSGRLATNEDNTARVGTIVTGRVTRILATVGDAVKKGQPLIYIHSHELLTARADAQKASAMIIEKEKALAYAKAELDRADRLVAARAISRKEQATATANVVAANAELDHAKAELTRASEWLEHLTVPHDSHDDIVIYSPMNGIVVKRNVTVGTVVNEATDLISLANFETLWAIAEVPQYQAAGVRIGQSIEFKVSAFGDNRFKGQIVHIGEVLNPDTRTVQVRCLVNNSRGNLRPEMFATITIDAIGEGGVASSPAVPSEAVQDLKGEKMVFILAGEGIFEKRTVKTGREQDGMIEILSGLQPGQKIVKHGGFFIKSEMLKSTMAEE